MIIHEITEPLFSSYGRILSLGDTSELFKTLESMPIPDNGNCYEASVQCLNSCSIMQTVGSVVFGELPIQCGYCNGNGHRLNALEYHKCSEVNYTTTGMVLLLGLPSQLNDGFIDSSDLVAFRVPPDVLIEIFPLVLHFAPCRVDSNGFRCLVVLLQGTNLALDGECTYTKGEGKLLWMKNKWLTCHPDSPQAANGAFAGITGINIDIEKT